MLLDALRHGFINLASKIGLLVFDEAHHAADRHPYNAIMADFYWACPDRPAAGGEAAEVNWEAPMKPLVLGLTASPIFGGNIAQAFA